jgi:hypothetical protein
MAAVYPAGPLPIIKHSMCSGELLIFMFFLCNFKTIITPIINKLLQRGHNGSNKSYMNTTEFLPANKLTLVISGQIFNAKLFAVVLYCSGLGFYSFLNQHI